MFDTGGDESGGSAFRFDVAEMATVETTAGTTLD
jgi:hypothetical protein